MAYSRGQKPEKKTNLKSHQIKMSTVLIAKASLSALVGVVLWEHFARISGVWAKPTYFIDLFTDVIMIPMYRFFGRVFAIMSSFFEYLKLYELGVTCAEIVGAVARLLLSWKEFFAEYCDTIAEYMWKPMVVAAGSILLVTFLLAGAYYAYHGGYFAFFAPFIARFFGNGNDEQEEGEEVVYEEEE
jgi:hypothetical protein